MELTSKSYFNQIFDVSFIKYEGSSFGKKVFIFPGQGSSIPGMYRNELKKFAEFQNAFSIADQFSTSKGLGRVSDYVNSHELIIPADLPYIRNLALFTSQVAVFNYLNKISITPEILTAHSFGEYAVLVCAGVVPFESMLEIVYMRDVCSPKVNELGSLVALSSSESDFKKLDVPCDYTIANINSKSQIVVAVAQKDMKTFGDFLKLKRLAARPMESVGRPYHSQLMNEAKTKFRDWLSGIELVPKTLTHAFLSSVTRQAYSASTEISREKLISLLTDQLTTPVDFLAQSEQLRALDYHSYIELGLASVCNGFIKTNLENFETACLNVSHFLSSTSERKKSKQQFNIDGNNKYFKLVSKYIGDITGYEISDISVGDNFQEDLQIDSIKKAEIVFRILEEVRMNVGEGVSISQLHEVGDVVEYFEKLSRAQKTSKFKKAPENFKLLTRKWVESSAVVQNAQLIQSNQIIDLPLSVNQPIPLETLVDCLQDISVFNEKILLVTIQQPPTNFMNCEWLTSLMQNFAELIESSPHKSQELVVVLYHTSNTPFFSGLRAFFKSLLKEYKNFIFKAIINKDAVDLNELLRREILEVQNPDVMYSEGKRWGIQFQEISGQDPISNSIIFSIGGTKGILFEVYKSFNKKQNCDLIVMGRSPSNSPDISSALKKISKNFKSVTYIEGDACDPQSLNEAVLKTIGSYGKVDLFVNSAGHEVSKILKQQTEKEILSQLTSKFDSLHNLLNIQSSHPTSKIINFSSVVGHFGNEGQTVYSFANGYLDAFKNCRHIHWPPMDGVGMTNSPGILQKLRSMGVSLMTGKQAAELLSQSLSFNFNDETDLFYLNPKDLYLYEYHMRSAMLDRKVFGDLADPTRLTFAKSYDLKNDSYLRDHHIESTSVVAAATGIAAFSTFGSYFLKEPPTIENFEIKNMIIVNDRENMCIYQPEFVSTNNIKMTLHSQVEHFSGNIVASKTQKKLTLDKMTSFKASNQVKMDSFYSIRSIDYGQKFQVMDQAYFDDNKNVIAVGKPEVPFLTGLALNDYISYLIELSFQSIYLKNVLLGKGLGIPLRIAKIQPLNLYLSKTIYVVPSAISNSKDDGMIYGGAVVYDGSGRAILNIEGVEMSTIRLYEASPFSIAASSWGFHGS